MRPSKIDSLLALQPDSGDLLGKRESLPPSKDFIILRHRRNNETAESGRLVRSRTSPSLCG